MQSGCSVRFHDRKSNNLGVRFDNGSEVKCIIITLDPDTRLREDRGRDSVECALMSRIKLKIQVLCDDSIAIGPGKADLLERIMATGSISAAARDMGMSYRRAWQLVDVMNRCWADRLVETNPGRASGGARITSMGETVLQHYRALQTGLYASATPNGWQELSMNVREKPLSHQQAKHELPSSDPA